MKRVQLFTALLLTILLLNASALLAQTPQDLKVAAEKLEVEQPGEKKARETIEKNSATFRFGLSLGWRHIMAKDASLMQDVAVDPVTGHVVPERIDRGALVLSGVVTAFPWRNDALSKAAKGGTNTPPVRGPLGGALAPWRLGFLANINVASFTQDNISVFNKSVEGGLGVAYKMNEDFSLALTVERVFGRSLRSFVVPNTELRDADGTRVTELASTDDRYFKDDNLSAWSVKFVYFFK